MKKTGFYLVIYDIDDDRRRNRVANELENYGTRVQRSVFECILEPAQFVDLRGRVERLLDLSRDRIGYYPICEKDIKRVKLDGPGQIVQDHICYLV